MLFLTCLSSFNGAGSGLLYYIHVTKKVVGAFEVGAVARCSLLVALLLLLQILARPLALSPSSTAAPDFSVTRRVPRGLAKGRMRKAKGERRKANGECLLALLPRRGK